MNQTYRPLTLSLVIPVYNEEETIALFVQTITDVFKPYPEIDITFVFVNDGSNDTTLGILLSLQKTDPRIQIVDLSRNFGKEAALTAGIYATRSDVVVPIDVDLQDPPEVILAMIEKWQQGYEVVLGHRINRHTDTWLKRFTAHWFYKVHNAIASPKLPENVGDFRLMDNCVVEALKELPESSRFMKGLFAWVGFKTTAVEYIRAKRSAGKTKFNGWKLWNFALEGVTSFSTYPLRVWTYLGFFVSCISFTYAIIIITKVFLYGIDVPGYASIMATMTFLGGLQLIGIGVLGEYLGRNYLESKRRPVFIIRKTYISESNENTQTCPQTTSHTFRQQSAKL